MELIVINIQTHIIIKKNWKEKQENIFYYATTLILNNTKFKKLVSLFIYYGRDTLEPQTQINPLILIDTTIRPKNSRHKSTTILTVILATFYAVRDDKNLVIFISGKIFRVLIKIMVVHNEKRNSESTTHLMTCATSSTYDARRQSSFPKPARSF